MLRTSGEQTTLSSQCHSGLLQLDKGRVFTVWCAHAWFMSCRVPLLMLKTVIVLRWCLMSGELVV